MLLFVYSVLLCCAMPFNLEHRWKLPVRLLLTMNAGMIELLDLVLTINDERMRQNKRPDQACLRTHSGHRRPSTGRHGQHMCTDVPGTPFPFSTRLDESFPIPEGSLCECLYNARGHDRNARPCADDQRQPHVREQAAEPVSVHTRACRHSAGHVLRHRRGALAAGGQFLSSGHVQHIQACTRAHTVRSLSVAY